MNAPMVVQQQAPVVYRFDEMRQMAEAIAASGLFGMREPTQALALMLVAQAEGLHPATAAQEYDLIQGKACRKTHSVLARFQAAGGKVDWHELTDEAAIATFSHPSGGSVKIDWTIDRAKKTKVWNKKKEAYEALADRDMYRNYPRAMLRARCIAEGVRAVFPGAIGGMLVAEEAYDAPERDITPEPEPPKAEARKTPEAKPPYGDKLFEDNFPKWQALIESKKRTADEIIKMAETRGPLTDDQKKKIRHVKVPEKTDAAA